MNQKAAQVRLLTSQIDQTLQAKTQKIRNRKLLEQHRMEQRQRKDEEKKKALMKQQVEKRKAEEQNRAKKARDMIEENRRRVQLQSELVQKGAHLDPMYRNQLQGMTMNRQVDIQQQMESFYYQ